MKVNDYVRTEYGIAKIIKIDNKVNACQIDIPLNDFTFVLNENIIKSSPNIIDLIEVGDYVNGYPVKEIYLPPNEKIGKIIRFEVDNAYGWDFEPEKIYAEDIKSILTKEQFESMEYRLGGM